MNKLLEVPADLLLQLRALLPKHRMTYGEARIVAELQARRLRRMLHVTSARMPLAFVERIPGVTVDLLPAHQMQRLTKRVHASGATDVRKDGTYRVYVNQSNSVTHCRFTMAHELYHIIAGPLHAEVFADFGYGNDELHRRRAEQVADHFAACLLMPSRMVEKAWGIPIRGLQELAGLFGVSEDAMQIRLRTIGLVDNGLTKERFYREPRTAFADALVEEVAE